MPALLLVEQRKMIFYNKTLHNNSIVLRILCALHRNEAKNCHLCITFFLDTHAVLTLSKGRLVKFCKGYNLITCAEFTDFCFFCIYCCNVFLLSIL